MSQETDFPRNLAKLIGQPSYGKNQKEVAAALNISDSTLSGWISGRSTPSFTALVSIARYFNVTLDYLVFGDTTSSRTLEEATLTSYISRMMIRQREVTMNGTWLSTRILAELGESVHSIAQNLATNLSVYGIISMSECMIMESYSLETWIAWTTLNWPTKTPAVGFSEVWARNISKAHSYRHLISSHPGDPLPALTRLRDSIRDTLAPRNNEALMQHVKCRQVTTPIPAELAFYRLDVETFHSAHPILYTQIEPFVHTDESGSWIGDICTPNGVLFDHCLMEKIRFDEAKTYFATTWKDATEV